VHTIDVELMRLDELQKAFFPQAKGREIGAGALIIKIQERRATLMGLNTPMKVDPIQLAADWASLELDRKLRVTLENFLAQDKKRLINSGAGYGPGSWQDIQDKETMAERVAKGLPAVRVVAPYDPTKDWGVLRRAAWAGGRVRQALGFRTFFSKKSVCVAMVARQQARLVDDAANDRPRDSKILGDARLVFRAGKGTAA
jgi:hypothetical protein